MYTMRAVLSLLVTLGLLACASCLSPICKGDSTMVPYTGDACCLMLVKRGLTEEQFGWLNPGKSCTKLKAMEIVCVTGNVVPTYPPTVNCKKTVRRALEFDRSLQC